MTALPEYQRIVAGAVRGGGEPTDALALFHGSPKRRERAFNVYANNAMHALVSALGATFPVVRRLLDEPGFTSAAIVYARRHPPPRDALLLWYGKQFPRFLETLEVSAAPSLADLARLEFAWLEAYHAAEAEPLAVARLATLTPEQLIAARLSPHPSLRLLRSPWTIGRIWRGDAELAEDDRPAENSPAENGAAAPSTSAPSTSVRGLIIVRPCAEVLVLPVSLPVFDCLVDLCAGAAFGDAAGHLDQAEAAAELQALIAAGLFTAIDIRG